MNYESEKWVPTYIAYVDENAEDPLTDVEVKVVFESVVKSVGNIYKNDRIKTNEFTQGVYSIISRITMAGLNPERHVDINFKTRLKVNDVIIDEDIFITTEFKGNTLLSINYPLNPGDKLSVTLEVSDDGDPLQFIHPSFLSVVRLNSTSERNS